MDDLLDTIRQKLALKWNHRRKSARSMDGKILPHIVQKLKEQSRNLNMNVLSTCDAIAEVTVRGGLGYRFVVNLDERTC